MAKAFDAQADTHINNQYNTCYWALRQQAGKSAQEAQAVLTGTRTNFKNELLFSQFGINYNELPAQFRKGSVVIWLPKQATDGFVDGAASSGAKRIKRCPQVVHVDIIGHAFWKEHAGILAG
jgi:tRNA(His) guanylyltransferase